MGGMDERDAARKYSGRKLIEIKAGEASKWQNQAAMFACVLESQLKVANWRRKTRGGNRDETQCSFLTVTKGHLQNATLKVRE